MENMPLPTGKVNPYKLAELIFPNLETKNKRVLVPPGVGLDASIIQVEDKALAISSDPITGAQKDPGWLSVHVNANDVATMGATPKWFLATVFLSENSKETKLQNLMGEIKEASKELNVSIIGGHTEVTPGLNRTLISGTMVGEAPSDRWVSAAKAEPEDRIIFTKSAGVEGTYILAMDREKELKKELGTDIVNRAKKFRKKLSVVEEALTAVKTGYVHAMHDPTEGGLIGGLYELADASEVGFSIESKKIQVVEETSKICKYFGIDPFRTIGSGSLLICCDTEGSEKVLESLREKSIEASDIGRILDKKNVREFDGESLEFPEQDELWKIFE